MGLSDYEPELATKKEFKQEHPLQEYSPEFAIGTVVTPKDPVDPLQGWWRVTGLFGDFARIEQRVCKCQVPLEPCGFKVRVQARRRGSLRCKYRR